MTAVQSYFRSRIKPVLASAKLLGRMHIVIQREQVNNYLKSSLRSKAMLAYQIEVKHLRRQFLEL
jgi:hypothetical protein